MFYVFHNLRVGTKILSGYAIALFLMVAVTALAVYRLEAINRTVADLADNLAQDQHIADTLVNEVLLVRLFANKYISANN